MDVQGFECHVLDGMKALLLHVHRIKTEMDNHFLIPMGCSGEGMAERLRPDFDLDRSGTIPGDEGFVTELNAVAKGRRLLTTNMTQHSASQIYSGQVVWTRKRMRE